MKHAQPDANTIRIFLDYDPESGILRWKRRSSEYFSEGHRTAEGNANNWNSINAGKIAGNPTRNYLQLDFAGQVHRAHRVAWCHFYGVWPKKPLDHIDGNGSNNAINNLREADHRQNGANRGKNKNNTSGFKGVTFNRATGKWSARIKADGWGNLYLGQFISPELAAISYNIAASYLHGEFARAA